MATDILSRTVLKLPETCLNFGHCVLEPLWGLGSTYTVHLGLISANLLTFNTSKNEFLLIGLEQQLAKINSCSLDTVHSARNLGFIFDEHLTFLTRYLLFLNPATYIFVNFDASVHILISKQPAPLLPPSFTISLTTAAHFTITYLNIS